MTVEKRIRLCLFVERVSKHKNFCEKLGVENVSRLHGQKIRTGGETIC